MTYIYDTSPALHYTACQMTEYEIRRTILVKNRAKRVQCFKRGI